MYCKHCGKEISDDSNWCPECGKSLSAEAVTENPRVKFHCPKCKSKNLQITAGASSADIEVKHTWFCMDCGNQFRDPTEMQKEFVRFRIVMYAGIVLSLIAMVLSIGIAISDEVLRGEALFYILISGVCSWVFKFIVTKKKNEYDYLRRNCFD